MVDSTQTDPVIINGLTQLDLINGTAFCLMILVSLIVGFTVFSKYIKTKQKALLYLGLTCMFLVRSYLVPTSAFLSILLTENSIPVEISLIIGFFFQANLLWWMLLATELMFKKKQKVIIGAVLIYLIIFSIFFLIILFNEPSLIATRVPPFYLQVGPLMMLQSLISMPFVLYTGIKLYLQASKSENPEVRLKGKLILLGLILNVSISIVHSIFANAFLTLAFFIMVMFAFYGGFLLPNWMKKLFLRKEA